MTAGTWPPRAALVSGATGGIGGAVVAELRAIGCDVVAAGRDQGALERLAALGCHTHTGDLRSPGYSEQMLSEAVSRLGGLDLVVAAAGIGAAGPLAGQSPEAIRALLDVDLVSVIMLARAAIPELARARGRLVLIGSVSGAMAPRDEAVYAAAKAGVAAFAAALRSEVAGSGVSVTLVLPAVVDTAFFRRRGRPAPRLAPAPRTAADVAARALTGARLRRAEVWVPRWLDVVSRLRGIAPGSYHRLADALGASA